MHGTSQVQTTACPAWCTTEHGSSEPHDSESLAVEATGRTTCLFVRLTQRDHDPAHVELQDDTGTVACLTFAAAGALVRAISSLVGR